MGIEGRAVTATEDGATFTGAERRALSLPLALLVTTTFAMSLVTMGTVRAASGPSPTVRPTVAVAPLAPLAGDEPWIGHAVADAVILRLHRRDDVNALTLRQVSAAVKQVGLGLDEIGLVPQATKLSRQLGARYIVTGDYSGSRGTMRLSIRIIDADRRLVAGEEKLTGDLEDLIAMEAKVSACVFRVLGDVSPEVKPGGFGSKNLSAWSNTARALLLLRRQSLSPRAADPNTPLGLSAQEVTEATHLLNAAIKADPSYGRAYAALALSEALAGHGAASAVALTQAGKSGAADDPLTILVEANLFMRHGQLDQAEKTLRAAVAANPGFLHARGNLGHLYNHVGRFREARATFQAYSAAVPRQPWVIAQIGYDNARLGKRDQAVADTRRAIELLPDSAYLWIELASRYIDATNWTGATEALERAIAVDPKAGIARVRLGYVHLRSGDDRACLEQSRRALELLTGNRNRHARAYAHLNMARAHGRLGAIDDALAQLSKAKQAGVPSFFEVDDDPALERLRKDPRYAQIVDGD